MIVVPPDRLEMRGDRAHWDRIHPAGNRRHRPQRERRAGPGALGTQLPGLLRTGAVA